MFRLAPVAAAVLLALSGCGGSDYTSPREIAQAVGCSQLRAPSEGVDWTCRLNGRELTITDWRSLSDEQVPQFKDLARAAGADLFDVGEDFSVGGFDRATVDEAKRKLGV